MAAISKAAEMTTLFLMVARAPEFWTLAQRRFVPRPGTRVWIPETLPGVVAGVDEMASGDVTTGIVGTVGIAALIVGVTSGVGTVAAELTPRFPISTEPKGTPTRAAPPGVVGVVGVEDAAMLLEPEPHIPDMPAVSMIPEAVDMPELCIIPEVVDSPDVVDSEDDMPGDTAVFPAAPPVAGIDAAIDTPPPS
jgi:hypothetical protein